MLQKLMGKSGKFLHDNQNPPNPKNPQPPPPPCPAINNDRSVTFLFFLRILRISRVINLLFALLNLHDRYSNLRLDYRFKNIVYLFSDSHVSQFIFEPCHLLLEDETHSTRYH